MNLLRALPPLLALLLLAGCGAGAPPATQRPGTIGEGNEARATQVPAGQPSAVVPSVVPSAEPTSAPPPSATSAPPPSATSAPPPSATSAPPPSATSVPPPSATSAPLPTAAPAIAQVRALWVDAFHDGFRTPQQVAQLLADAGRANLNTLIVQVRRRGDAFYSSSLEPRAETGDELAAPLPPGFDPLQELLTQAHAQGIEVHAWIAALPVWHDNPRYQTSSQQHVWHRHGPGASGADSWVMLRRNADGSTASTHSLDPGHPAAAQYTLDVALDLASRYDIDGLHLDYIRYGGVDEGYNPVAVERFNQLHGRSGLPDPADEAWLQWRRDQVTGLVRRIYVELQRVRPRAKLSAATIAWGAGPTSMESWRQTAAYKTVLQDWRAWSEEGILDLVMPMNYDRDYRPAERAYFDQWAEWQKDHQYGRHVLVGPGGYLNYIEDTLAQIRRALAPAASGNRAAGVSIYDYASSNIYSNDDYQNNAAAQQSLPRQPWEFRPELNASFFTALARPASYSYRSGDGAISVPTEPVFASPASIPAMPWKLQPSRGALRGLLRGWPGAALSAVDGLTIRLAGPETRTLRSDGNGWFGAVELQPGTYQLSIADRQGRNYEAPITIGAGTVASVELAIEP